MNTQLMPGETTYRTWGALNIRIDMHTDGVAITVDHHATLNRALPVEQARTYLEFLRDEAKAGKPLWLIEAQAGVLTSAVLDDAERAMVDGIRAHLEQATPKPVDVSDILADAPTCGGWNAFRQQVTRTAALTSEPMDRILITAVDGFIPRSKDATSTQLVALKRRGLVELVYGRRGNRRVIVGARVTDKGAKHAGNEQKELAA